MQSNNPYGEGPLSLAEMNRSFKEALEGWLSSCSNKHDDKGDASGETSIEIESRDQLLVLVAHLALLALGFKVQGKETADPYPRLPSGWNAAEPYCFEYMHPLSQYHFQFKSITAGNRLFTHATALETRETYSFDVVSEEYVCNHALFPLRVGSAGPPAELDLGRLFSGRGTFKNYLTEFQLQIVQKLVPGLQKESCLETPLEEETRASFSQPRSPPGPRDNSGPAGADAAPSNFQQGRHPLAYGDRDLDPLGGVGPGLPRFGVGSGAMDPARMIGGDQGGMILGPHHPMFSNPDTHPVPGHGPHLPPGAAPPGARFDPITPFDPSIRNPRGRLRGQHPRPPFSGEPDNDEAPPPGYDHMFM